MLHFTPHKRAYKAHREDKKVGGIGDDTLYSGEFSTGSVALDPPILGSSIDSGYAIPWGYILCITLGLSGI